MTSHLPLTVGQPGAANGNAGTIRSFDPSTGELLPDSYLISDYSALETAGLAGKAAAIELSRTPPERIAEFLETYAGNIEANGDQICHTAALETALPYETRLRKVELPRTADQLRQAAAAVRERSWCMATIDTKLNIRSMFRPLNGPVVIFGPNNFPLAFNAISGGDFAAAIAAGNPVIAKAHPGHLSTSRLLAEAAQDALQTVGLPPATVQMFYHCSPEDGLRLVAHESVTALAFTGSRQAGLALKHAADASGKPSYLELSSVNPIFILPGALAERLEELVAEFVSSCTLGMGQFCTNPGLVILPEGENAETFLSAAAARFSQLPTGSLLSQAGASNILTGIAELRENGADLIVGGEGEGFRFSNALLRVSGENFLANPMALQTEIFGPAALIVSAKDVREMTQIAGQLEGNLTGGIYSDRQGRDDDAYNQLEPALRAHVGRLLNDKMPTGVAVSPAMVHGGPYPATGHPGFTAVGIPAAIHRFAALQCYDGVRQHRLPQELQDKNPTGVMWRMVNGHWTQNDV